jgi:hypothetical protein
MGGCEMGECEGTWNDCNGDSADGCETQAQCACAPGEQIACYTGFPASTQGVGQCQSGLRTCNAQGTGFGACTGQVIPAQEVCGSGLDENCNGQVDENPDLDLDGWGHYAFKPEESSVAEITVPTTTVKNTIETMGIIFEEAEDGAHMVIGWDNTVVRVPIKF